MDNRKFLSRLEAAEFINSLGLKISPKTLAKFASIGGGPEMRVFGRRVFYEPERLLEWVNSRLSPGRRSTSDPNGCPPSGPSKLLPGAGFAVP